VLTDVATTRFRRCTKYRCDDPDFDPGVLIPHCAVRLRLYLQGCGFGIHVFFLPYLCERQRD
jgi:hypothetical protein